MKVLLLHGPNLNLLGERQESVYGSCSSQDIINRLNSEFPQIDLQYFQSNNEHELIDKVHAARNGSIVGLGVDGYPMALECLIDLIKP